MGGLKLMRQLLKILGVVLLLSAAFTPTGAKGQEAAKAFGKTFPDGSAVRLTESTITEFRSRPRSANPDAPEQEIYSGRREVEEKVNAPPRSSRRRVGE
jgi:hypothetical protein